MVASTFLSSSPGSPAFHLASTSGFLAVFAFLTVLYLLYTAVVAVYLLYFHPLKSIPGPRSWIVFPFLRHIASFRGLFDPSVRSFFNQYHTDVVRIAPNEVYFVDSRAWNDIYGHGHTPQMPKPMRRFPDETHSIINADDASHTRFRKALAHSFSERALREQEPLLQEYTSLLIKRLSDLAAANKPANMTAYYNFTTFDVIGDLAFGQPFGCLASNSNHWWVENVSAFISYIPVIRAAFEYPLLMKLLQLSMLRRGRNAREATWALARERVNTRRNNESQRGRADFIDLMEKHKGDSDEISDEEMVSNMFIIILAGSETTATLLSGLTFHLLKNPAAMRRITAEIRSTFQSEDEIRVSAVMHKLPYTMACFDEALRIYPPVPSALPRQTLKEETIAGYVMPKGCQVGVHQTAAYWSETNFHRPNEFIPERWLKENTANEKSEFYNDDRAVHQPFHMGPRNCIGKNLALAEMRLILTRVLWNFDLELCDDSQDWLDKQRSYTVWAKGSLMVRLTQREVGEKA